MTLTFRDNENLPILFTSLTFHQQHRQHWHQSFSTTPDRIEHTAYCQHGFRSATKPAGAAAAGASALQLCVL